MGALYLVFPGATHTRFAHSLGVLEYADRFYRELKPTETRPGDQDWQNIRLSAMLHDLGHAPFSHNVEHVFKAEYDQAALKSQGGKIDAPNEPEQYTEHPVFDGLEHIDAEKPYHHETIGHVIIERASGIHDEIGSTARRQIVDILEDKPTDPLWHGQIVSNGIDVDKLDYVQRDCRALGIGLGGLDADHMVRELQAMPSGSLGITEQAMPALQQLHFARYTLRTGIVFNKNVNSLEETITTAYRALSQLCFENDKWVLPSLLEYLDMLHGTLEGSTALECEFYRFDDSYLMARFGRAFAELKTLKPRLGGRLDKDARQALNEQLTAIVRGEPFKTVCQVDTVEDRSKSSKDPGVAAFQDMVSELATDTWKPYLDRGQILIAEPQEALMKPELAEVEILRRGGPTPLEYQAHPLNVFTATSIESESDPLAFSFMGRRIYAAPSVAPQARKLWDDIHRT